MSINTQAIVLKLLLSSSSESDLVLEFDAAKSEYFSDSYRKIRHLIAQFYEKYNKLPNLTELRLANNRSGSVLATLDALANTELPDEVELSLAIEALESEYAQQLSLTTIQNLLLKDITLLNAQEITERLAEIQTHVSDSLDASDKVFTGNKLSAFQSTEDSEAETVLTSISPRWDFEYGGLRREDLLLLGGKRGSGKSVMSMNFAANQYRDGKICPYFTIEMRAGETFQRFMANLSGADAMDLRNNETSGTDIFKLLVTRAAMFEDSYEVLSDFLEEMEEPCEKGSDLVGFEASLRNLPEVTPFIIVDDSQLRLASVDAHLGAIVAKYGEQVTACVVDYVNQVIVEDQSSMYDWKDQLVVAKGLKNLARKHEVAMISPYQINNDGEARLSQAILDPADYAMIIHAYEEADIVVLEATKVRSISNVTFAMPMDWQCLRIKNVDLTKELLEDMLEK